MSEITNAERLDRPKIFVFINGHFKSGDVHAAALAEDGVFLAHHLSSDEQWARHDMGIDGTWKHDIYSAHYPNGYDLEWIPWEVSHAQKHPGLEAAYQRHLTANPKSEAEA